MTMPGSEEGTAKQQGVPPRGPSTPLPSEQAALLSSSTKAQPVWPSGTPRWILQILEANANVPVRGGVYQVNRVTDSMLGIMLQASMDLTVLPSDNLKTHHSHEEGAALGASSAQYGGQEIHLQIIQALVKVHTRVPHLFSDNHDQLQFQLKFTADHMNEVKENLVFNHPEYGLLNNVSPDMQIQADGPPSPDVLDDLLARAWKRPDLFAMHPEALAEFRKEANARSLTLEELEIFGSPFTSWRGLPIVPTNKLHLVAKAPPSRKKGAGADEQTEPVLSKRVRGQSATNVLLMRLGVEKQGVVSLYAAGVEGSMDAPFISVDFMGLSEDSTASYLMTTYAGMAVHSAGALARAGVTV
jgi:hypothetical protein